jgi:hypothetical protein
MTLNLPSGTVHDSKKVQQDALMGRKKAAHLNPVFMALPSRSCTIAYYLATSLLPLFSNISASPSLCISSISFIESSRQHIQHVAGQTWGNGLSRGRTVLGHPRHPFKFSSFRYHTRSRGISHHLLCVLYSSPCFRFSGGYPI